jgi:hypothetical protein
MRLLNANSTAEVEQIFDKCAKKTVAITKQITQICWYMRGGVNYDQAWNSSPQERDEMMKLINENIQRVKETKLPLL